MSGAHHAPSRHPLPPLARAHFDRALRTMGGDRLARALRISRWTIETLADDGLAQQRTIDKVVAGLEGISG